MSLPRRVPWASLSQLDQVYVSIYSTEDWEFAIKRLSAWKFAVGLPHALDAALSLLVTSEVDVKYGDKITKLAARHACGLAIVRFVNGLVDPLQTGVYARSISTIASQIGLPLTLVELRHACTHEELPSLEVLRDGIKSALSWLEKSYFLPTLAKNASKTPEVIPPLAPLLKQYKVLMKSIVRDRSIQRSMEGDLASSMRSFDAWIAETATAAWNLWDSDATEREAWALEKLCIGLTQSGGLVPLAKKKQPTTFDAPNADIWIPLLDHIQGHYPAFATMLIETIVMAIVTPVEQNDTKSQALKGRGYYNCLSGWLLRIMSHWGDKPDCDAETVALLLLRCIPREAGIRSHIEGLLIILKEMAPHVVNVVDTLGEVLHAAEVPKSRWTPDSFEVMQTRLDSSHTATRTIPRVSASPNPELRGWKLLGPETGWRPCPIGS